MVVGARDFEPGSHQAVDQLITVFASHPVRYDQFRTANVEVTLRSLRRMPIADRGEPALLARHLTYALGQDASCWVGSGPVSIHAVPP